MDPTRQLHAAIGAINLLICPPFLFLDVYPQEARLISFGVFSTSSLLSIIFAVRLRPDSLALAAMASTFGAYISQALAFPALKVIGHAPFDIYEIPIIWIWTCVWGAVTVLYGILATRISRLLGVKGDA